MSEPMGDSFVSGERIGPETFRHDNTDLRELLQKCTKATKRTTHNDIINKANSVKHQLSYNGDPAEAQAKHLINELIHRLGNIVVSVRYSKELGWHTFSLYGRKTKMTRFQVVLWKLFKLPPKGTILDE